MPDPAEKGSALGVALELGRRRQWLAVGVFVLAFAGMTGIATFLPNIYRSTATVLVERHQVPETFVRSSITGEVDTRLQTIGQEILSRTRLEDLITRFGLYPEARGRGPMEAVVEKMRRDVQLELKGVDQQLGARSATVAFNLSYRGRDPETVARVTNTLASFYVDENSRIRERQASHTAQFLKDQLTETKKRLDAQEARIRDFRARNVGELPQQMGVNLATLERLQAQLNVNSANQLRARDRRAALVKQLAESDVIDAAGSPDTATAKLAKLKRELLDLRMRFSDKYPDVRRVKAEIAALERELVAAEADRSPAADAPVTHGGPPIVSSKETLNQADAEITSLKAEAERLRRDMSMYQRRIENAPQREQELKELSGDFETAKEIYASLAKRYEDAQLAESMEQSRQGERFRILDLALPPKQPFAPNRIGLLLVGGLLAVGAAAAAAMLAEHLDTSFHTLGDLGSFTKVPVLASIPRVVSAAEPAGLARQRGLVTASITLGLAAIVAASYYLALDNDQLVRILSRGSS